MKTLITFSQRFIIALSVFAMLATSATMANAERPGRFTTIDIPGAVSTITGGTVTRPNFAGGTYAAGINAHSDVVGYYTDILGRTHGFALDRRGGWFPIDYPGSCRTDALAINDDGDIVGTYFPAAVPCPTSNQVPGIRGYLLRHGHFTSIDVPGATFTGATGINDEGDIVGHFGVPAIPGGMPARMNAFLLRNGIFTSYAHSDAESFGKMTCGFGIGPRERHRERDDCRRERDDERRDAEDTRPQADIVGHYLDSSNVVHGFVLDEWGFTTIDYPGVSKFVTANGINAKGEIVGYYYDLAGSCHGFLRDKRGVLTAFDVDVPGAWNTFLWHNNAKGDFVGKYTDATGIHGFLMERFEGR